ncbi:MAG: bifunctional UDP-N-acetylglucosamine diphosphorylase/glucosamine-1-phosphate N-acetyltransferase GlmU [Candidatus Izemoplasmatales bacterium]|jgi:bifunctional UDP-N-acetylglucosamine pyrophosphorylase/glucosamine-1-phosphate N-acetyltransferase
MKKYAIVLAAGKGTRMKTEMPKCAYPILRKPMIAYIVENLRNASMIDEIIVVVGHKHQIIRDILQDAVTYAFQEEQLGTAHAVMVTEPQITDLQGDTIILPGDMPLVNSCLLESAMREHHNRRNDLTLVTTNLDDPSGYGRIVRNDSGYLESIIEHHEANAFQRLINEVNTGVYVVKTSHLFSALKKIDNHNLKNEYYLTDIIKVMKANNSLIGTYHLKESYKALGINDLYALSIAESRLRQDINKEHMRSGVAMINPDTITIGHNVKIEGNVIIHPNTYITGNSVIRQGAQIGPDTEIHESIIGENVICHHSLIYNSIINKDSTVGPFAHLRNGTVIGERNRIGNFVEVKKSTTGANTKASHLAYIGDATVGKNVNFGCGSITVNFDGQNKYQTTIGDDVFIGCNVNMIAPINIEEGSLIAAGSTLNKNVPKGSLAIARAYQVNKENYLRDKKQNDNDEEKK